ncbi:DUF2141 domain-containing protein [Ulvibacter antarcticus]|uniref:Uncharacterized protein (DUF2141 family) n=1 Tax=Ulvibacter antarcticus TaxID=442714 RepID=A0A3L9YWL7_9FLAO|nr:DUF2141 domain-containing protein [Ulvibacter antarcticus]RMA64714.1 uncharacterized protein (DUF2141 family) [Ulvibacter antarcticus]
MQTILTYLTLLCTGLILQAQNTVDLKITGFENNDGQAMIALYNSEDSFLATRYKGSLLEIKNKEVSTSFSDLPDGIYAVSIVHDEDKNGKLNMIMGFIPSEETGSSNDAPANFGPPTWEDAKFELRNGEVVKMQIKMN